MRLPVIANTPCNGCYECCRNQTVLLLPMEDRSAYECEPHRAAWKLKAKANGDCVYLDRSKGCTIYDRRPAKCKVFDCVMALKVGEAVNNRIKKAARRLAAAGHVPVVSYGH